MQTNSFLPLPRPLAWSFCSNGAEPCTQKARIYPNGTYKQISKKLTNSLMSEPYFSSKLLSLSSIDKRSFGSPTTSIRPDLDSQRQGRPKEFSNVLSSSRVN